MIRMNDTQKVALKSERDQLARRFSENISLEDGVLFYLHYEDKMKKAVRENNSG